MLAKVLSLTHKTFDAEKNRNLEQVSGSYLGVEELGSKVRY